mgnify:CR=1 FL=1
MEIIDTHTHLYLDQFDNDFSNIDCQKAKGLKCSRCWKVFENLDKSSNICDRCNQVLN